MHHKRRSRRRDKAIYAKCGCCIIGTGRHPNPRQEPVENEICMGKTKKKVRPKKGKCPENGTHEWYREWIIEKKTAYESRPGYWNCDNCIELRNDWDWFNRRYCLVHEIVIPYETRTLMATCIHCWITKREKDTSTRYWDTTRTWRGKKKLPKRKVKF